MIDSAQEIHKQTYRHFISYTRIESPVYHNQEKNNQTSVAPNSEKTKRNTHPMLLELCCQPEPETAAVKSWVMREPARIFEIQFSTHGATFEIFLLRNLQMWIANEILGQRIESIRYLISCELLRFVVCLKSKLIVVLCQVWLMRASLMFISGLIADAVWF